ncbi:MAG: lysozyme inhibitor LprI family protein [Rhizomicrobium sp.]
MRTLLIGVAAALLLAASPSRADESDGIDCDNAMTQTDMNICADKDYRAADKLLNAAYAKAMAGLDAHNRDLLRTAQRQWIKFRDAECTYESAPNEGGSMHPLSYSGCMTTLTLERTKLIKAGQL